jgi:uncharacterized protein
VKRVRYEDLQAWKTRPDRKPLLIRGARQVGKSYLVRSWGKEQFSRFVELNIERDPRIAKCFVDNDPFATLKRLEVYANLPIVPDENTLLFIDEIQAAPELLAKLRWFAEEVPPTLCHCRGLASRLRVSRVRV